MEIVRFADPCEHGVPLDCQCYECEYIDYLIWGDPLLGERFSQFDTIEEDRGER